MKQFLVPAFFSIDAHNATDAQNIAKRIQNAANDSPARNQDVCGRFLFLDEKLPTREVPRVNEKATYLDLASLRESIQDDLLTYLDGMDYEVQTHVCQIVVDNFKRISGQVLSFP